MMTSEKSSAQLELLFNIASKLTSILNIDDLLKESVELLRTNLDLYLVGIGTVAGERIIPLKYAISCADEISIPEDAGQTIMEGITGRAVSGGKPVIVDDVREDPDYIELSGPVRSELAVPVKTGHGEIIAVLDLESLNPADFDNEDLLFAEKIAAILGTAIENARLFESEKQQRARLELINKIAVTFTGHFERKDLLDQAVKTIRRYFRYGYVLAGLVQNGTLQWTAGKGEDPGVLQRIMSRPENIVRKTTVSSALSRRETVISAGRDDEEPELAVPVIMGENVGGVLFFREPPGNEFPDSDIQVLETVAFQTAVALEHAKHHEEQFTRLRSKVEDLRYKLTDREKMLKMSKRELADINEELQQNVLGTVLSLARALEAKDSYSRGHSDRVAYFCTMICNEMEMPEKETQELRTAALLHDIGKIGISDAILQKPGPLNEMERKIIEEHSVIGADICEPLRFCESAIPAIRYHHEYYGGGGYPEGLSGKDIPLGARIMLVADAFESMTSDRPYRESPGMEFAVEELKRYSGVQFDPEIVDIFINVLLKEGLYPEP